MKRKYCLIALLILFLDHAAKWIARAGLESGNAIVIIPGYLRFSYVQNSGVAFGFFDNIEFPWKPYILAATAVVAIVVIWFYSARMPANRILLHWALAVTMGGILGNLIDRILRGYVIDFIEFHIHKIFHWPNFNIADSAITVGIALLLLDAVKNPAGETATGQTPADGSS
jgi:signal peptidase II